jgi:hypothetical protein
MKEDPSETITFFVIFFELNVSNEQDCQHHLQNANLFVLVEAHGGHGINRVRELADIINPVDSVATTL